jgi:plasmid stabilization system protein ParE
MARRLEWTLSATADLQEIADYIAKDSRRYAASVVRKIRDNVRLVKRFPKRGAVVPELGIRQFVKLVRATIVSFIV